MGDFIIGQQKAGRDIKNTSIEINQPEELARIEASLQAIKKELNKIHLPEMVNREKLTGPIDELLTAGPSAQKDSSKIKEKLEKVNESLGLFGKTLKGISTIVPHIKTIAEILKIGSLFI